jgi:hypothetical protein
MALYTRNTTASANLNATAAWTPAALVTSADEGTWISSSAVASALSANWAVGKLSFGSGIGGDVTITDGATSRQLTIAGLLGVGIDLSGNTSNRTVTLLSAGSTGSVVLGASGVGDISLVLNPTTVGNLVFNSKITKSSGTVTISGSGGFLPTTSSDASWTGGSVLLDSGIFYVGNGSAIDGNSGVLGAVAVSLVIGTNSPSIITGSGSVNRGVNNPVTINGSFTLGGSGTGRTRLEGPVTVNAGSHTITVPAGTGGAYLSSNTSPPIQGSGDITKAGAGPLLLGTSGNANGLWTGKFLATGAGTTTVVNTNYFGNALFDTASVGVTLPTSTLRLGGITGSTDYAFPSTLTTFTIGGWPSGGGSNVSASWSGGFTSNVALTKINTGTQTLSGNSTGRTTAGTTISAGAIQLNSATGLYAAGSTNTTTVSSGAGLWLNGVTTNAASQANISGDGVLLNGALRNVGGSSTHSGTVTLGGPARVFNDVASTTFTLKNLVLGANTLTVDTGATSTATILLDGTGNSGTSATVVIAGSGLAKAPRATTIPSTSPVTVNAGARLQFTATAATIANFGTLSSTAGATPARIILGA